MNVDQINYGAEDARNLRLKTMDERQIFLDSYVLPTKFKLDEFFSGYKYFVFGGKGAGKTALLQYIRIAAIAELSAHTSFYYFQSSFSKDELKAFLKHASKEDGIVVDDSGLDDVDEAVVFWRLFLLTQVAKSLKAIGVSEGAGGDYLKLTEIAKLISRAKNVGKKYPSLQKFSFTLSKDPQVHLEGTFESATVDDLEVYMQLAEDKLDEVHLDESPIFIFIDEMEVYLRGDETDALRLAAIASLVRAVRDFNERFGDKSIRVIAAIRDAVVSQVSTVQGEVHRIIMDNGVSVDWPTAVKSDLHPLERMVLNRIVVQDDRFGTAPNVPTDHMLRQALTLYFPGKYSLRTALNLTWYRPRDIALLFEEAAAIDQGQTRFTAKTLADGVIRPLGKRLWQDAISGLAVKYKPKELNGIDRILRGGRSVYGRTDLLARMELLSHTYDDVALLSDTKWIEVLEDLYRVGAIYYISSINNDKNFAFRGDPMPSLTDDFEIGVHQVLVKELSLKP